MTSFDPAAINASVDIVELVGRYTELKRVANEYVGRCLNHSPDNNPSMTVSPMKQFAYCFSCGWHADPIGIVRKAEGVDFKEACARLTSGAGFPAARPLPKHNPKPDRTTWAPPAGQSKPDMRLGKLGDPVAVWTYRTAEGDPIGYIARYAGPDGNKEIRCWSWGSRRPEEQSTGKWECGAFSKPRPLYGMEKLGDRSRQVLIVEGEKAADAAQKLFPSMAVVTWPGGAGAVRHADWAVLAGRSTVIWPDADDAGRAAVKNLTAALRHGGASKCKVVDVQTILVGDHSAEMPTPEGWDAADALASGWTPETALRWAKGRVGQDVLAGPPEPDTPQNAPESPTADPAAPDPETKPSAKVTPITASKAKAGQSKGAAPKSRPGPAGNTLPAADPEADTLPPAYSQDALARHLVDRAGDDWKHTASRNQWYRFNGAVWEPEKTNAIFEIARAVACAEANNSELSASLRRELAGRSTAAAMVVMASWDRRIATPVEAWDTDPMLLGTPEGVIDLSTGKKIEASREQLITMSTVVAPGDGTPKLWMRCLSEWCGGDKALMDYLQRLAGYLLTGHTREQMFAFIHGPASSGKTKFIEAISRVLGSYAANAEMETFTESRQERHSSELARLRGKRMVYAAETEEGRRWAEAKIKKLSGEDVVTARNLYENPEEFSPQFKLIVYGNHAPHLRNPDASISRRLHIIPFVHPIPREQRDDRLREKLAVEYPQILAWAIEGCLRWQSEGLEPPEAIQDAVTRYMDSEDTFGDWIAECIERDPEHRERSAEMYKSYRSFIEARGESPVSQKRFASKMEERGFRRARSMGMRMFEGGKLRAGAEQPPLRTDYAEQRRRYDGSDD